jgi:SAM-dependent methyltransferase
LRINKIYELKEHYENLFFMHKDSFKTAQQSSRKSQEKRMSVLVDRIKFQKKTRILDFGCGTAHLYNFLLKNKEFKGHYTGIDIAENIIEYNKKKFFKNNKVKFLCGDILKKNSLRLIKYDYVFISGTFNNKFKNNWLWMRKILKRLFSITKKAIVFNNLSTYVDYRDKNLFYVRPELVFEYCKLYLSNFVEIRHNYQIKKKVIPFEFTTYVYKKN